jgi:NAD(P)-dependent dehydrogenase (short-subunit alcohol dehydrogenase family)
MTATRPVALVTGASSGTVAQLVRAVGGNSESLDREYGVRGPELAANGDAALSRLRACPEPAHPIVLISRKRGEVQ